MGSKMVSLYGLGPLVNGLGLFQPVLSYNNTITISAVSDRYMMPDPAFYMQCLQESFDELKAATIEKPKAATRKKDAKKTPKKVAKKKTALPGNGAVQPGA
jgi:hypothetical protein